jgi:hypothetical protein
MKFNQKGFAHFFVAAVFILVAGGVAGAFIYVRNRQASNSATNTTSSPNVAASESCDSKEGLRICVSSSKSVLSSSETVQVTTVITNTTKTDVTRTFSCTATDPWLVLNDKGQLGEELCGQAITDKTIKANSSETFEAKISGSILKEGKNKIIAKWQEFESGEIIIERTKESEEELSSQFKACQSVDDGVQIGDTPSYCGIINLTLDNSAGQTYSCSDFKTLLAKANLKIPCNSAMDFAVGFVYVPRTQVKIYLDQIKALPEIESAASGDIKP